MTANSAAETSPSVMKRIRAPASRICATASSWRARSSMITRDVAGVDPLALGDPPDHVGERARRGESRSAISGPPASFSM